MYIYRKRRASALTNNGRGWVHYYLLYYFAVCANCVFSFYLLAGLERKVNIESISEMHICISVRVYNVIFDDVADVDLLGYNPTVHLGKI